MLCKEVVVRKAHYVPIYTVFLYQQQLNDTTETSKRAMCIIYKLHTKKVTSMTCNPSSTFHLGLSIIILPLASFNITKTSRGQKCLKTP